MDSGFVIALQALMEFRYFAQAPVIDDEDCARIIEALKEFHNHKHYILAANA